MSVPLSKLLRDVLAQCPKASNLIIAGTIEDAVLQFYRDSLVKSLNLTAVPLVADQAEYALPNPDGWQIIGVRWAEIDKVPTHATSEEQLDLEWQSMFNGQSIMWLNGDQGGGADEPNWRYATSDRPWWHYQTEPNLIRLVGIPTTATDPTSDGTGLTVNAYVHPLPGVIEIEDFIYNSWNQVIVARAVADLLLMPGKPWSNPKYGAYWATFYDTEVGKLTSAALRGHARNNNPVLRTRAWR